MPALRHIAVLLDARRAYHRKMIRGLTAYCREIGSWRLHVEEPDAPFRQRHCETMDGIIASISDRHAASIIATSRCPVVAIEGRSSWSSAARTLPAINTDNQAVARMAVEHLVGRGFRRLGFIGMKPSRLSAWADERGTAFRRCVETAGATCTMSIKPKRHHECYQRLMAELPTQQLPIGLLAANDAMACCALDVCRQLELRVPEDVAVIGVDNDDIMCELAEPTLTSIELNAKRIGYEAACKLNRLFQDLSTEHETLVPPAALVERESTDALALVDRPMADVLHVIRTTDCRALTVAQVIKASGMSRSLLCARFKAAVGRTMQEEICRVRLEHAKRLMLQSSLPLKAIAHRCGFSHLQHFANTFRKHVGETPGQFRSSRR